MSCYIQWDQNMTRNVLTQKHAVKETKMRIKQVTTLNQTKDTIQWQKFMLRFLNISRFNAFSHTKIHKISIKWKILNCFEGITSLNVTFPMSVELFKELSQKCKPAWREIQGLCEHQALSVHCEPQWNSLHSDKIWVDFFGQIRKLVAVFL